MRFALKLLALFAVVLLARAAENPTFNVVPGRKPGTFTFDLRTVSQETVLKGRDMSAEHFAAILSRVADVMDAFKSDYQFLTYPYGDFGFVIRSSGGRVVAFSGHTFSSLLEARQEADVVKYIASHAVVTISPELFDRNGASVVRVMRDKAGKIVVLSDQNNGAVTTDFETKAEVLRHLSEYNGGAFGFVDEVLSDNAVAQTTLRMIRSQKNDAIDSENDPARFEIQDLQTNYFTMEKHGWTNGQYPGVAWPDTYWPTLEDGLNRRWQHKSHKNKDSRCDSDVDCLSPLEKYDLAFNHWQPPQGFLKLRPYEPNVCKRHMYEYNSTDFDQEYYKHLGPAAHFNQKATADGSQLLGNWWCHDGKDNSRNGLVDECDKGGCEYLPNGKRGLVEGWFGLCHAWVPAAILFPEPQHAATHGEVPFQVSDVKGLLMQFDFLSYMLSYRCETPMDAMPRDEFGRIIPDDCRDTNPGAFHIVLANLLGRDKRPFAFDRSLDSPVWNQPVTGFNAKGRLIQDAQEACEWLGGCREDANSTYSWNPKATQWVAVNNRVNWVTEVPPSRKPQGPHRSKWTMHSDYEYLLELDNEGTILGGEWRFNHTEHPDFLWLPYDVQDVVTHEPHVNPHVLRVLLWKATSSDSTVRMSGWLRELEHDPLTDELGRSRWTERHLKLEGCMLEIRHDKDDMHPKYLDLLRVDDYSFLTLRNDEGDQETALKINHPSGSLTVAASRIHKRQPTLDDWVNVLNMTLPKCRVQSDFPQPNGPNFESTVSLTDEVTVSQVYVSVSPRAKTAAPHLIDHVFARMKGTLTHNGHVVHLNGEHLRGRRAIYAFTNLAANGDWSLKLDGDAPLALVSDWSLIVVPKPEVDSEELN